MLFTVYIAACVSYLQTPDRRKRWRMGNFSSKNLLESAVKIVPENSDIKIELYVGSNIVIKQHQCL